MSNTQSYFTDVLDKFYENAIKNHSKKQQNIQKEKEFFHKWEINSLRKINASSRSLRASIDSRSSVGGSTSRQKQNGSKFKRNDEYFQCHWLFQSSSFQKTFIYSYLYFAIENLNSEILDYIQVKFVDDMQINKQFDQIQQKKISHYWAKIKMLLTKKQHVRWEKVLQDSIGYLPQKFLKLVFFIISQKDVDKSGQINQELIQKISKRVGLIVNYYHIRKKQILQTYRGKVKSLTMYKLNIVYIQQLKRYMMSDKELKKPNIDEAVQKIFNHFGSSLQKLLQIMKKDEVDLHNLDNMLQDNSQNLEVQSSNSVIAKK